MARLRGFPSVLAALTVGALTVTGAATFAVTVTATGQFLAGDGSAAAPGYGFASSPSTGHYRIGGAVMTSLGGSWLGGFSLDLGSFMLTSALPIAWSSGPQVTPDLTVYRDAADVLAQRRGANAQTFRLYNTYTDAGNYSRLAFNTGVGAFEIIGEAAGTGTPLSIQIKAGSGCAFHFGGNGAVQWNVSASGHLLVGADNTYDIGVNGTSRVRQYFGVYLYCDGFIQSSEAFRLANRARIAGGESDGIVKITDWVGTDFGRICFGGLTSSFPAIKRNGAKCQARLADDSDYGDFEARVFDSWASGAILRAGGVQIVGQQGTAVADATGAGDVVAQLNTLLARLRAHGLIAT